MTATELKTKVHERIETLTEEQLKKLQEIIEEKFDRTLPKKAKRRGLVGSMKGIVTYMADDFNEPLDDFKEYMPDQHDEQSSRK